MRVPHRHVGRRGWTIIEMTIAAGILAVLAAVALPNIDFQRLRMDANTRNVHNQILGSAMISVTRNMPVIITFFYTQSQFRIVQDANGNGLYNSGERRDWRSLSEGMKFVIPPSTIDGAGPYYATGPGIRYINAAGTTGTCTTCPTLTLFPNGSTSGDAVVYLGSGKSARKEDFRAVQIYASTSKVKVWRMMSDGQWKMSDM